MRIIAGKARRLNLKTLEGLQVRPTTDRIKETLFNIIQNDIAGCNFLDLFSGSGAIGLEAASRDAKMVYLVESSSKAQSIIEENIAHTKLYDNTKLIKRDFRVAISELSKKISFDIIFADPPYKDKLEEQILDTIYESDILKKDGQLIIEADLDTDFEFANKHHFTVIKEKIYKTNKHVFLVKSEES